MTPPAHPATLVTGGSRGIGRAVALELARHGHALVIQYRADRSAAEQVRSAILATGGTAAIVGGDVGRRSDVARLVEEALQFQGHLDSVVTCAGTFRGDATPDVGPAEWEDVIRTDLEGTFRTVQACAGHLRGRAGAAVVTVSSILGSRPSAGGVAYQSAKAGVESMTRALALELAPGIRVNCVAPGYIRTDMNAAAHGDPAFARRVASETPLGRWGEPDDVAPTVRFLLDDRSSWITGSVVHVDGGLGVR